MQSTNQPSQRLIAKWNRIDSAYEAEMEQLLEQLFPEDYQIPDLVYWDGSSLWDDIEMFGLVLVDHTLESLKGFWVDQETGDSRSAYYLPEADSDVETISIDNPPTADSAWDARPL